MFPLLFSPITINGVTAKNRILYPSLALLYSYDKTITDRHIAFYRERAAGGAGIVTIGPIGFDKYGSGLIGPTIEPEESIESFARATKAIHDEGALAWIQLYHAGAYSHSFMINGEQAIAPSAVPSKYTKETPREMTLDDIHEVHEAYVSGALHARDAGFDGVEIIGSAGYLITQFLSPLTNKRTDVYGGSLENRLRFAVELIGKLRAALGPAYPLSIRMAGNDFVPGSNTSSETPVIARAYEDAGIDLINVTGGWHESKIPQLPMALPRGAFTYLSRRIRDAVTIPVVASNRITDPLTAEEVISDGLADMVSLGRVLIADPQWPRKAERGDASEIRPCVACSQGCTDSVFSGKPVYCILNPRAGYEEKRKVEPSPQQKKVFVVGAGPAGLEAAVTAAQRGHNVTLYEKEEMIGGQLWLAGAPPHKQDYWNVIDYYYEMIDRHGVHLVTGVEVNEEFIAAEKPDYVIVAQGARQVFPPVPGLDEKVLGAWDVLGKNLSTGKNVAVIGGGAVGLETAHFLAVKGTITPETLQFLFMYDAEDVDTLRELATRGTKNVTVFEMLPKAGQGVGKSTKWILFADLDKHGVTVHTETTITSIENGTIHYTKDGNDLHETFDTIICAAGSASVNTLGEALERLGIDHAVIGDSKGPGKIDDAIHGGFKAAVKI